MLREIVLEAPEVKILKGLLELYDGGHFEEFIFNTGFGHSDFQFNGGHKVDATPLQMRALADAGIIRAQWDDSGTAAMCSLNVNVARQVVRSVGAQDRRNVLTAIYDLTLRGTVKTDSVDIAKRTQLNPSDVRAAILNLNEQKLISATPSDEGAKPAHRLAYRVGLATGLRRSELEDLVWGDVRLTAIPFAIQLRAEATKARRGDRVYLPATLAQDLAANKPADASDTDPVFDDVPSIKDWRADLKAAKIPYKDEMGRQADFHAGTRKTLCTRLHCNNVPLVTAMKLMRHTDTRLTAVDYTDDSQLGTETVILPEPTMNAEAARAAAK